MAQSELEIILKVIDNASAEFKKVNAEAIKQVKDLEEANKSVKKATDEVADSNKKDGDEAEKTGEKKLNAVQSASKAFRALRAQMLIVTAAFGTLAIATVEWAKRNDEARASLDQIGLAASNFGALMGKITAETVYAWSELAKMFNNAVGEGLEDGFAKAQIAVKNFDEDLKKLQITFQAGQISSEQYFNSILDKQNSIIGVNRQAQQSLNELANVTSQINNRELLEAQRLTGERIALVNEYKNNHNIAFQGMAAFTKTMSESIRTNVTSAFTDMITGVQSAKEAFAELGQAMIRAVVEFMVQKVVAWVLEKTLLAGTVAASRAAGAQVAAAWAQAAAFVSLATLGANAIPAAVGIASVSALSTGLATAAGKTGNVTLTDSAGSSGFTKTFHDGGIIRAHNGLAVDEVPIIAQTGEGILSRRGMAALGGEGQLNRLNSGGGDSAVGDVYVTVNYPKMNSREEIQEMMSVVGSEIQRQLRYARA